MHTLCAAWQIGPATRAESRQRVQHRGSVPERVPRHRAVLPACHQPCGFQPTALDYGRLVDQDPFAETPRPGPPGLQALPDHSADGKRPLEGTPGRGSPRRRKGTADSAMGWYLARPTPTYG